MRDRDGAPSGANTDGGETVVEFIVFLEDADPAVAALPFVEDEILAQTLPGATAQAVAQAAAAAGATVVDGEPEVGLVVLRVNPDAAGDAAERLRSAAELLADSGLFESIQKNYLFSPQLVPNDPRLSSQAHLARVGAIQAWDITTGDADFLVAVVDTGVDADHPDLMDQMVEGVNIRDGGAQYDDPVGHGTMVAGVVGAIGDNGVGVAGVAWRCGLLAVRVGDEKGQASARHVATGILWAINHGAKVINVSFAPLWSNRVVQSAAQAAFQRGAIAVISAGNGGSTATATGYEEAIFVSAVGAADTITSFSDRGPFIDITAPGEGLLTTQRGGGYGPATGTSFAAPIVSGVVALAWSMNPGLRPSTVLGLVTGSGTDLGAAGVDSLYGHGLVNADAAVRGARNVVEAPDATPPTLRVVSPASGATLTARATVKVEASDDVAVADVAMLVDGVETAVDSRSPYQFLIDPASFSAGAHVVTLVATDTSGKSTTSSPLRLSFSVSGAPSTGATVITFQSPTSGATVSGNVTIQANVSDADGLAVVEWFVDGEAAFTALLSGTSSGVSYVWRTSGIAPGAHEITLRVIDAQGNAASGRLQLRLR